MTDSLDWSPYRGFPTTPSVRSAISVADELIAAAPHTGLSAAAKKNLARLTDERARLATLHDRRARAARKPADAPDLPRVDLRGDRAWGAIEMRLAAWDLLALGLGADHPQVKRAAELHALLFAAGTTFLQLPYREQRVEMDRLLRVIEKERLKRDLIELAGQEFFDAIHAVQPEYDAMVRFMLSRESDGDESLIERVRALMLATERYASSLIGNVDFEDDRQVAQVRAALAPLRNYREAVALAGGASKGEPAAPASSGTGQNPPAAPTH